MDIPDTKRKYSKEEKKQLLANLDIEVSHKIRQFEAWLSDTLESFRIHQEGQISRVPKLVRALTMREFGEKYDGDVQAALRGLQRERMGVGGAGEGEGVEIEKSVRKRKWVASVEAAEAEGSRSFKNARTNAVSPKKKPGSSTGPGTAQRARLIAANKTPGTSRTMGRVPASPSPSKPTRPTQNQSQNQTSKPHPSTSTATTTNPKATRATRPPSSATFNPLLPKTPGFPSKSTHTTNVPPTTFRVPRRHESMLSLNGSPLANPYELGLEWFADGGDSESDGGEEGGENGGGEGGGGAGKERERRKRAKSIVVRRDPSFSFQSAPMPNGHGHALQRATSQSTLAPSTSSHRLTTPRALPLLPAPTPAPTNSRIPSTTALVTIPTKDGHLLSFDPLQTSPGTLDALEGITDSAKKQAREEMGRLVQAAVSKWSIV